SVLVFFSGFACAKQEMAYMYATIAKRLNGIDCILFDYYGCADSPGDVNEITIDTMLEDARAVLDLIASMYPTYKIYLVGKGLSVHILKLIANDYEIHGVILFDGHTSIRFPFCDLEKYTTFRQIIEQGDP